MQVFLAFLASFYAAVVLLDFVSLVVLVVAVVVALGMRSLAQLAAKQINSDMVVQNAIENLNRLTSQSVLKSTLLQTARQIASGCNFQLAANVRQIKAINLPHTCLTPRFYPTPVYFLA